MYTAPKQQSLRGNLVSARAAAGRMYFDVCSVSPSLALQEYYECLQTMVPPVQHLVAPNLWKGVPLGPLDV